MEQQYTKIKFYARRSFGEKLNATFDFIKQNWKPLLKYATYFILPLCLFQAYFFNKTMSMAFAMVADPNQFFLAGGFQTNYYLGMFLGFLGGALLATPVYTLMQLYNSREEGLRNINFNDMKPTFFRNMGKYFLAAILVFLCSIILIMPFGAWMATSPQNINLILLLFYTIMLIFFIPLSLIVPINMFEEIGTLKAFVKSFKLGFATWGGIFAVAFVIGIICTVIGGAISLPYIVTLTVNSMFDISDLSAQSGPSTFYSVGIYLLAILTLYVGYILFILFAIGIAYQYAHANEKINSISVVDEIDQFENF